eukprot:symbB.v1.2.039892.t1/scaffold6851.1/size15042/2
MVFLDCPLRWPDTICLVSLGTKPDEIFETRMQRLVAFSWVENLVRAAIGSPKAHNGLSGRIASLGLHGLSMRKPCRWEKVGRESSVVSY